MSKALYKPVLNTTLNRRSIRQLARACGCLWVVACSSPENAQASNEHEHGHLSAEAVPATTDKVPAGEVEPAGATQGGPLSAYESLRAALAKDALDDSSRLASALERSARMAAGDSQSPTKSEWAKVAEAAKVLSEIKPDDADAVRKAFGEVSRHLVAVLQKDAALAKGLHVFQCPMAQGYKKWVQPDDKLENPYMGTKMLACGSASNL